MPAYTIMIMRRDATDRRPLTLHISNMVYWGAILLAVGLPVVGFLVSAGVVAPAWLRQNVSQMKHEVQQANQMVNPLKQQNASLTGEKARLRDMLQTERTKRAEVEARVTMAETARAEASQKLTELEAEVINLKKSQAEYEQLLKPKLAKNLLECSNLTATYANGQVAYDVTFAKVGKGSVAPSLTVEVNARNGNNAMTMGGQAAATAHHTLALAKNPKISGRMAVTLPPEATHMVQVWVKDGATPVGYCWKAF